MAGSSLSIPMLSRLFTSSRLSTHVPAASVAPPESQMPSDGALLQSLRVAELNGGDGRVDLHAIYNRSRTPIGFRVGWDECLDERKRKRRPVEGRLGSLSLSYVDSSTAGRSPVSQASTSADMGSGKTLSIRHLWPDARLSEPWAPFAVEHTVSPGYKGQAAFVF